MGSYINSTGKRGLGAFGKADALIEDCGALEAKGPPSWDKIPDSMIPVCVVTNPGMFEAAAVMIDEKELDRFKLPEDERPKRWLVMDRGTAFQLSGYKGK